MDHGEGDARGVRAPAFAADGEAPGVVVVGAGPVGLTTALLLARHGVACVVLDAAPRRGEPAAESKAICQQRDVLDIWDRVGVASQMLDEGVTWTRARTFYQGRELFTVEFDDPGESLGAPGVSHPDTPATRSVRARPGQSGHVAGTVDRSGRHPGLPEVGAGGRCGPPLHHPGRVYTTRGRPRVEPSPRGLPKYPAAVEDGRDVGPLGLCQLSPADAAHRAVRLPGAENPVDLFQTGRGGSQGLVERATIVGSRLAPGEAEHGAHRFHGAAVQRGRGHACSELSAACTDWA